MKKSLSVMEFKKYVEENPPMRVIYSSENQIKKEKFLFFNTIFDNIIVEYAFPNMIYLSNNDCKMHIRCIDHIEINTKSSPLGTTVCVFYNGIIEGGSTVLILG